MQPPACSPPRASPTGANQASACSSPVKEGPPPPFMPHLLLDVFKIRTQQRNEDGNSPRLNHYFGLQRSARGNVRQSPGSFKLKGNAENAVTGWPTKGVPCAGVTVTSLLNLGLGTASHLSYWAQCILWLPQLNTSEAPGKPGEDPPSAGDSRTKKLLCLMFCYT